MSQKRKKEKKYQNTKKPDKNQSRVCCKVLRLLVASVRPVARSPPACPRVRCVARPPARLPLLPMTRSSVPGCLVMVLDDNV